MKSSIVMKKANIKTLEDLTKTDIEQLKKMKNFGTKSFEEIKQKLAALELTFNMDCRAWATWGLAHLELIKNL